MFIFYFYVNCKELKFSPAMGRKQISSSSLYLSAGCSLLRILRNPLYFLRARVSLLNKQLRVYCSLQLLILWETKPLTRLVRRTFVVTCPPLPPKNNINFLFTRAHIHTRNRTKRNTIKFPFFFGNGSEIPWLIRIDPAESAICFLFLPLPQKTKIVLLTDIHVT